MSFLPRLVPLLLIAAVAGTPPASAQSSSTGRISGSVVTAGGAPISGATVTVSGSTLAATTNAFGRFALAGVNVGTVSLVAQAPGFLDHTSASLEIAEDRTTSVKLELRETPNFMEQVQVTASKVPQNVGEVAAQVDVIDRATIDRRGAQTLTQAITHVPGAVVSTQLGLFESVMLRGLPRGDPEFTNTLLLVDGVPQTNSNNGARVVALPINDAGTIEVTRGPNSAVYGRTAIGGSVNVRTADPTPEGQLGLDLTAGGFDTLKGLVRASGPLKHIGGYYVSLAKERNHGYFDSKTTSDYEVGNTALFGKLTVAPDGRSFGSLSVNRVDSENHTPTNEPIVEGRLLHEIEPQFDRFTSFNIPGPNYEQGETRVTLQYARELASWARAVGVSGYRDVRHEFIDDGDFIGTPYDLAAHTVTMYPFSQRLDEDVFYNELRLELTPKVAGLAGTLTLGGSYEHNRGSLASDFIYTDPDLFGFTINYLNPVIPPREDWQHDPGSRVFNLGITGLFGQYIVEPTPRLILTAGGRYDRLSLDNTRDGAAKLTNDFDALSPKLSAMVKLLGTSGGATNALNAYAAYSQSFLPPRRPSSLVPADVTLDLKPEEIENYEAGLKGSLLNGRVSLEATYFWMKEDGVVLSTRQGPFFLPTNAGEQRYRGLETGIGVTLSPRFSFYANTAFYHNRFGSFVIETEDGDESLTGNRLPISPDHVVNGGLVFSPVPSLEAVLNVKHIGAVQTNRQNTFELDPYSLVDAALTWRRGTLRVTLSAHNLLDAEYYWNGDGETADPGRPRQILVTTSLRFR